MFIAAAGLEGDDRGLDRMVVAAAQELVDRARSPPDARPRAVGASDDLKVGLITGVVRILGREQVGDVQSECWATSCRRPRDMPPWQFSSADNDDAEMPSMRACSRTLRPD
jgi:hypothetical protein